MLSRQHALGRSCSLFGLLLLAACAGGRANSGPDGGGAASAAPFEADGPDTYVPKVKALLTGGVASADELAQVHADAAKMGPLVQTWLRSPAGRQILLDFFADAFQQSQATSDALRDLYDQQVVPDPNLVINLQQSFARTALDLADRKASFTEVASSSRYMMTTAMMAYYAYTDTSVRNDAYKLSNRWTASNPNFAVTLVEGRGPVSYTAAADASGADYMTFYLPGLSKSYAANNNATVEAADMAACAKVDPVRLDKNSVADNLRGPGLAAGVYALLRDGQGGFYKPAVANPNERYYCRISGLDVPWLTDADYNDWHAVTVRKPTSGEELDEFFDLPTFRKSDTLLMSSTRVGYLTTPAFLAQYPSNVSNQSRATTNQALIVGLGGQVDGSALLPVTFPTAVDPSHAADPACFSCHQSLDPMRQYLRQSYSVTYSEQTDRKAMAPPAGFSFGGTTGVGTGVADFASLIANHPQFATAWVVKLCNWATSGSCMATDPELLRIASDFRTGGHDFYAMAEALLTSPLVTYAKPTLSARTNGKVASIARRHQFCATLNARLGLDDVCDRAHQRDDGGNSVASRTAALAGDLYVRGSDAPLYLKTPDPFYSNNVENVCASLASQLVDVQASGWASSDALEAALGRITRELMGVAEPEVPQVQAILQAHFDAVKASGANATNALRSTFIAACRSPAVAALGAW